MTSLIKPIEEMTALIKDGTKLCIPSDYAGVSMSATRSLIRQSVRNLHLVCMPTSGFQAELLIGAGLVKTLETSAVTMGEYGPAPRFADAVRQQSIHLVDATCPAIHAGLQASIKGIPFMPLRGIIGSDLLRYHPDWKVIQNPFSDDEDPITAIPAITPDHALFHAPMADRDGNVWIGRRKELANMAQASKGTLVTVEKIVENSLLDDETTAAGVIPALYISAISVAQNGSWPLAFWFGGKEDGAHLKHYMGCAGSPSGFATYLDEFVLNEIAGESE